MTGLRRMSTFGCCSLGLTGFDSKMNGMVSKSGIEWLLVKKSFEL